MLQWGRDLSVAEGAGAAIMPGAQAGSFNGAATFRSRKGHRPGNGPGAGAGLQWGRDLSVAEGLDVDADNVAAFVLQWGRDLSVAEGGEILRTRSKPTSLQWGRDLSVAEGGRQHHADIQFTQLQWGRDLSVAEGAIAMYDAGVDPRRFNGAATFRSRKDHIEYAR